MDSDLSSTTPDQPQRILISDPTGLCLQSKDLPPSDAGIYSSLTHLASQLSDAATAGSSSAPPLITIETSRTITMVKEYDGHAVAVQVPVRQGEEEATRGQQSTGTASTSSSTTEPAAK